MEKEIKIDTNLIRRVADDLYAKYKGAEQLKMISDQIGAVEKMLPKMKYDLNVTSKELATETAKLNKVKQEMNQAQKDFIETLKNIKDENIKFRATNDADLKQTKEDAVKTKTALRMEITVLRDAKYTEEELLKQAVAQKKAMLKTLTAA